MAYKYIKLVRCDSILIYNSNYYNDIMTRIVKFIKNESPYISFIDHFAVFVRNEHYYYSISHYRQYVIIYCIHHINVINRYVVERLFHRVEFHLKMYYNWYVYS